MADQFEQQHDGQRRKPLEGIRILVVDDNDDECDMLATVLGQSGAHVVTEQTAEAAIATAHIAHPHVLLSDISLPGRDGIELLQELRGNSGAKMAAVAVTGWTTQIDRDRAVEAGFDAYLMKPVAINDLVEQIAKLVGRDGMATRGEA